MDDNIEDVISKAVNDGYYVSGDVIYTFGNPVVNNGCVANYVSLTSLSELYNVIIASRAESIFHYFESGYYVQKYTARNLIGRRNIVWFVLSIFALALFGVYSGLTLFRNAFIYITILFFANFIARFFLVIVGLVRRVNITPINIDCIEDDLPIYTIIVPLFKESKYTIERLVTSIEKLDYPKNKLDVKLAFEASDKDGIKNVGLVNIPSYFNVLCIPSIGPQTKPKACNFALMFARGEFVTIYDAEDEPEPEQLKKAVSIFRKNNDLHCLQAELRFYNGNKNILTRFFSIEYLFWFRYMISTISVFKLILPLGGTSNHFRIDVLRKIGGWDSYNVTEDAEIGVRLKRCGFNVSYFDSVTMEECPSSLGPWIMQRSRWLKGFLQTYLSHLRSDPLNELGVENFFMFQFLIGFTTISFLLAPIYIGLSMLYIMNQLGFLPGIVRMMFFISLAYLPIFSFIAVYSVIFFRWRLYYILEGVLFPFYFLLHSIAGYIALFELFVNPYKWYKTPHHSGGKIRLDLKEK